MLLGSVLPAAFLGGLGGSLDVSIVNINRLERELDCGEQAHQARVCSGTCLKEKCDAPVGQQIAALVAKGPILNFTAEDLVDRLDEAGVEMGHAGVGSLETRKHAQVSTLNWTGLGKER